MDKRQKWLVRDLENIVTVRFKEPGDKIAALSWRDYMCTQISRTI